MKCLCGSSYDCTVTWLLLIDLFQLHHTLAFMLFVMSIWLSRWLFSADTFEKRFRRSFSFGGRTRQN